MEAVETGSLALDPQASSHLDSCLSCLACETACPSGVNFHARIDAFRPRLRVSSSTRAWRSFVQGVSQAPAALRIALVLAQTLDRAGLESLRRRLRGLDLMPRFRPGQAWHHVSPLRRSRIPPPVRPRARAALLTGCAADVLRPQVTRAAVEVLHKNGVAVVDVPGQTCCGALALHSGNRRGLATCVERNVRTFSEVNVDFIASTASGCGATLKEYDTLIESARLRENARTVVTRARDITEILCALDIEAPRRPLQWGSVAYHDACHLIHAAKVSLPPRAVVETALGHPVIDLGENALCCGSAGSYNLERPRIARLLGDRKAELAVLSGVDAVAVGNVGCALQIELALARRGIVLPVVHPVELLAEAYLQV